MAVASLLPGTHISFAFPKRGGDAVYVTLEQLFLIAGFILALLSYIDHKKK